MTARAPAASSDAARATMRANRGRDTVAGEPACPQRGPYGPLRARLQHRALGDRRTIDVAFVGRRVAVLVDGCYWHACPEHMPAPRANRAWWADKLCANALRDALTDHDLAEAGWTVVRRWEHEDPEAVADAVEAALRGA